MLQLDFILVSHLNNNKTKRHWNRNYRAIDTAVIIIIFIIIIIIIIKKLLAM